MGDRTNQQAEAILKTRLLSQLDTSEKACRELDMARAVQKSILPCIAPRMYASVVCEISSVR